MTGIDFTEMFLTSPGAERGLHSGSPSALSSLQPALSLAQCVLFLCQVTDSILELGNRRRPFKFSW